MKRPWKVMIVDDMEVFRRQIRRLPLWSEDSSFLLHAEAADGIEALRMLEKEPVDLLISDIRMPRMDGLSLLKEVKARNLSKYVVFLSDYAEFSLAKEAIAYGIFDYLVKPVKEEELRSLFLKVSAHLSQVEKEKEEKRLLEEKLLDSVDLYYPQKEVLDLTERIVSGQEDALKRSASLVKTAYEALNLDLLKTALVLEKVYEEILLEVERRSPWLAPLYPHYQMSRSRLSKEASIQELELQFMDRIDRLVSIMAYLLPDKGEHPLVRELEEFILLHPEGKLTLDRLAEKFYLTKNHLGEVFKEETGLTLGEYLFRVKVQRAMVLLQEEELRSYEIAERLGYQSAEYFAKQFRKATGETPMEYRARMKEEKID